MDELAVGEKCGQPAAKDLKNAVLSSSIRSGEFFSLTNLGSGLKRLASKMTLAVPGTLSSAAALQDFYCAYTVLPIPAPGRSNRRRQRISKHPFPRSPEPFSPDEATSMTALGAHTDGAWPLVRLLPFSWLRSTCSSTSLVNSASNAG
jgi:hypothetical protein